METATSIHGNLTEEEQQIMHRRRAKASDKITRNPLSPYGDCDLHTRKCNIRKVANKVWASAKASDTIRRNPFSPCGDCDLRTRNPYRACRVTNPSACETCALHTAVLCGPGMPPLLRNKGVGPNPLLGHAQPLLAVWNCDLHTQ